MYSFNKFSVTKEFREHALLFAILGLIFKESTSVHTDSINEKLVSRKQILRLKMFFGDTQTQFIEVTKAMRIKSPFIVHYQWEQFV